MVTLSEVDATGVAIGVSLALPALGAELGVPRLDVVVAPLWFVVASEAGLPIATLEVAVNISAASATVDATLRMSDANVLSIREIVDERWYAGAHWRARAVCVGEVSCNAAASVRVCRKSGVSASAAFPFVVVGDAGAGLSRARAFVPWRR